MIVLDKSGAMNGEKKIVESEKNGEEFRISSSPQITHVGCSFVEEEENLGLLNNLCKLVNLNMLVKK